MVTFINVYCCILVTRRECILSASLIVQEVPLNVYHTQAACMLVVYMNHIQHFNHCELHYATCMFAHTSKTSEQSNFQICIQQT